MRTLLCSILLLAAPALANSGGSAQFKLDASGNGTGGNGSGTMYFGHGHARIEMTLSGMGISMKQVVLVRADKPQKVILLNDGAKTFTEMDAQQSAAGANVGKLTVKKLGKEKVAGYDCEHALVTQEGGETFEVWTTDKIKGFDYKALQKTYASMQQNSPFNELERAGLKGFMMKMKAAPKGGGAVNFEVTAIGTSTPDKTLFEIPAGYSKADPNNPAAMMGQVEGLPPEVQQQIMQQLQNLTPEQREQMRKMMGQ